VGVVPVGSWLVNLSPVSRWWKLCSPHCQLYGKVVGELRSRWNWTLRDHGRPIHVWSAAHIEAMEVQRRGLVSELVVDIDNHAIAHCCVERWQRPLAIDANGRPPVGIVGVGLHPGDVPIINARCCVGKGAEGQPEDGNEADGGKHGHSAMRGRFSIFDAPRGVKQRGNLR
jgi:hypothetical protein